MTLTGAAHRKLILGFLALATYGSLYPFEFEWPTQETWELFLSSGERRTSLGDLLGNIALYIPFGVLGALAGRTSMHTLARFALFFAGGVVFAWTLQAAQLFTPSRHPSFIDVGWNAVGLTLGYLAVMASSSAAAGTNSAEKTAMSSGLPIAVILAGSWALSELVPFVPSIDLQSFKNSIKPLIFTPKFSFPEIVMSAAGVLAAASLLATSIAPRRVALLVPLALVAIACAKIVVVTQQLGYSILLGWALGYVAFLASLRVHRRASLAICMLGLLFGYSMVALEPYSLRDSVGEFNFVPFADLLGGSMLTNSVAVVPRLATFAMFLWLAKLLSGALAPAAVFLSFWVGVLEFAQVVLAGRTASITDPLLILLLAWVLGQLRDGIVATQPTAICQPSADACHSGGAIDEPSMLASTIRLPTAANSVRKALLVAAAASAFLGFGLWAALRYPTVPYNIRELLLGDGHFFAAWMFALAVLWMGISGVLIGTRIANSPRAVMSILVWGFISGVVMYALLRACVTTESISDISGSANLTWLVTRKLAWGETARDVFLALNSPLLVSLIERPVRFSALYAPLPIMLGLWWHLRLQANTGREVWRFAIMVLYALPALLLCKAIAFDWSSTDNLNELIAYTKRDGRDGGAYLYALLAMLTFVATRWQRIQENVTATSSDTWKSTRSFVFSATLTLLSVPAGWWLLNGGLSLKIQKYGNIFSGAQFLLGPDRSQLLSQEQLFLRWSVVYLLAVLILALGIWLGAKVFVKVNKHETRFP